MVHELGLTYNVLLMQSEKRQVVNIVDEMYIHDLSQRINTEIFSHYQHEIDINQIQKIVEDHLMTSKYPQIARAYIEYRHDRDLARKTQPINQRN